MTVCPDEVRVSPAAASTAGRRCVSCVPRSVFIKVTPPALRSITIFGAVTRRRFGCRSRHRSFARRRNIIRAGKLKYILGARALLRIFGVHGDQYVAFTQLALIALGFKLGNAHADERTD